MGDISTAERAAGSIIAWLQAHSSWVLITTAAVMFGLAGVEETGWLADIERERLVQWVYDFRLPFFWIGVICGALGIILRFVIRPSYAELLSRTRKAELVSHQSSLALEKALKSVLIRLARHCSLDSPHQRISIYLYHQKEFVLLARYSSNPVHEQIRRRVYKDGIGVIGAAWSDGEHFARRLPEDRDEWNAYQTSVYRYSHEEARAIRMASKSICGYRIDHANEKLGVVVMESLNKQGVSVASLEAAKNSLLLESAGEILHASAPSFPEIAKRAEQAQNRSRGRRHRLEK